MSQYHEFAIAELKKTGFKLTKPRQVVVDLLAESVVPLTPYEMRDILKKKGIKADVVTIYRVLEVLEKIDLVHKVSSLGRYIRCDSESVENAEQCHHYLICKRCKKVEEIKGEDLHELEQKIQSEKGFQIESHYLEFIGICANCLQKVQE